MLTVLDVMHLTRDGDVDGLMSALKSDDTAVRAEAAGGLGQLGDTRATEALVAILESDPDPYVRSVAARALGELGAKDALLEALDWASPADIGAITDALMKAGS